MLLGQLVNGLVSGAMYALVAIGFTLIIGVVDKLNFAHPEVLMFGGFVGVVSLKVMPIELAFFAVFLVGGFLGLLTELIAFRRFEGPEGKLTAALASMALGLVLTDAVQKIWGTDPVSFPTPPGWLSERFSIAGAQFVSMQVLVIALTFTLVILLYVILQRTKAGRQIRAAADSPTFASLLGINTRRVSQAVFFISSALAAEAGLMLAIRTGSASSEVGLTLGLKSLAIMAIGGLGDLRGALLGGLGIGLIEALMYYFGLGRMGEMTVWVAMIVTLMFRPAGLFGGGLHVQEQRA